MQTNAIVGVVYIVALIIGAHLAGRPKRERGRHAATR